MDTIRPDIILRARLNRWEHAGAAPGTAHSASLRAEYRALVLEAADAAPAILAEVARAVAVADRRLRRQRDLVLYNFACEAYQVALRVAA